eukprot:446218-Amphidinium_carterae.1
MLLRTRGQRVASCPVTWLASDDSQGESGVLRIVSISEHGCLGKYNCMATFDARAAEGESRLQASEKAISKWRTLAKLTKQGAIAIQDLQFTTSPLLCHKDYFVEVPLLREF